MASEVMRWRFHLLLSACMCGVLRGTASQAFYTHATETATRAETPWDGAPQSSARATSWRLEARCVRRVPWDDVSGECRAEKAEASQMQTGLITHARVVVWRWVLKPASRVNPPPVPPSHVQQAASD